MIMVRGFACSWHAPASKAGNSDHQKPVGKQLRFKSSPSYALLPRLFERFKTGIGENEMPLTVRQVAVSIKQRA